MRPDVEPGQELPTLTRRITREDVRAYAEASGDRNPLHLDDDVARAAGFDGVIAHGMLTMGHLSACVLGWAGPGARVERISAQFRAPVPVGRSVVAGGRVRAVEGDLVTLEAWVRLEGEDVWAVRKGEVVVRLSSPDDDRPSTSPGSHRSSGR
ncbi:MAG: hypothetical protein KatS3mg013_1106 [Actinomycetota bacterium]|nr:MAG: hypothetical protein KatS3mg013_1106 [Actinomycetota bacterium]